MSCLRLAVGLVFLVLSSWPRATGAAPLFDDGTRDNRPKRSAEPATSVPVPATSPSVISEPAAVIEARRRFDTAVAAPQKQIDEAREFYIRELRTILKYETQQGHRDEALAVGDALRAAESVVREAVSSDFKPRVVDLLKYVDPARDAIKGSWYSTPDGLVSSSSPAARIRIPYEPPDQYDFRITFTPRSGGDCVDQVLCHRGAGFTWHMGGWDRFEWWGLDVINGRETEDGNPTGFKGGSLPNGVRCTSIVKVRRDGVTVVVNGKTVAAWNTDYTDFARHREENIGSNAMLGLRAYNRPTLFHSLELVELSGPGTPSLLKYVEPAGKHVDVLTLVDVKHDIVSGEWKKSGAGLLSGPQYARITLPYRPPVEYDCIFTFVKQSGNNGIGCAVPFGRRSAGVHLGAAGNRLAIIEQRNRAVPWDWSSSGNERPQWLVSGREYTVQLQVRSSRIRVYLDGQLVTECATNGADLECGNLNVGSDGVIGLGSHESPTLFKSAEVIEISGPGEVVRGSGAARE